jgi:2-phosphosulfolactate phosphatase
MPDPCSQAGARVRFEWGRQGLDALLTGAAGPVAVAVVDVLSFSTAVVVAAGAGVLVAPAPLDPPPGVPEGALLAGPRGSGRPSLSPASLAGLPPGTRLVLPSPNGGALAAAAGAAGATVIAAGIRNASAVAADLRRRLESDTDLTAIVLAAGERWPDGSLRPAIEDLLGSALVLAGLPQGWLSAEALAAAAAAGLAPAVAADAASARELAGRGFVADVATALERDASTAVPVLSGGWFAAATPRPPRGKTASSALAPCSGAT